MKRIREILLRRAADAIAAELSRQSGRRTSPRRIDMLSKKESRPTGARHANAQKPPRGRVAAQSESSGF
jgi:hypothetical protein